MIAEYRFVGIQLGTFKSVLAILNRFNIKIVLNQASQRQTPTSITFTQSQRNFGEKSLIKLRFNSQSTIQAFSRFITKNEQKLQSENKYSLAKFNNQFLLKGDFVLNQITNYQHYLYQLLFQLIQSRLQNQNSNKFLSFAWLFPIIIIIIKQIYKSLRAVTPYQSTLVSEKISIALDYYLNVSKLAQNVLFIDFGHSKISAYGIKISGDQIKELFQISEQSIGVRNLDVDLLNYVLKQIKFEINQKKFLRLKQIITKTRIILSANSEYVVHQQLGQEDLEIKLNRSMFEQICKNTFDKLIIFLQKITQLVAHRKLQFNCIQLFGGGSRIPYFQSLVNNNFKQIPIKKSVNSTQSIARGSTMYIHRKQKLSRLAKIQIKQLVKQKVYVYINFWNRSKIGKQFSKQKAEELQNHMIYDENTYNDIKRLSIQLRKGKNIQIWIYSFQGEDKFFDYYEIQKNKFEKESKYLHIDISTKQGYPKIAKIETINNQKVRKQIDYISDCQGELRYLRKIEQQFYKKDVQSQKNHDKLNYIESQLYKLKEIHPEFYQQHSRITFGPKQYDQIILKIDQILKNDMQIKQ